MANALHAKIRQLLANKTRPADIPGWFDTADLERIAVLYAKTVLAGRKVFVLDIDHQYGHNVTVHATEALAEAALAAYVNDEWDGEMEDQEKPKNQAQMVIDYFEHVEDESADIIPCEVDGA